MFKSKKTRMLEQAIQLLNETVHKLGETTQNFQQAVKLADDNAALALKWERSSDTWKSRCEQAAGVVQDLNLYIETLDSALKKSGAIGRWVN